MYKRGDPSLEWEQWCEQRGEYADEYTEAEMMEYIEATTKEQDDEAERKHQGASRRYDKGAGGDAGR